MEAGSKSTTDLFDKVDSVIDEPLKFKAKLAIGEDAYTSLRMKKRLGELWDTVGAASTAGVVAKSSVVASTFFAPSGFLAALGIGAAVTPIGWVIGAAIMGGGAWYGLSHYFNKSPNKKVIVIPQFINTPMDILALGLFNLMAPLSLKVASIDGEISESEKKHIYTYFVCEWGYNKKFIDESIHIVEKKLPDFSIKDLSTTLAKFQKKNPDCKYDAMTSELIKFLRDIIEVDGKIDEREEFAIEKIQSIFTETTQFSLGEKATQVSQSIAVSLSKTKDIIPGFNRDHIKNP